MYSCVRCKKELSFIQNFRAKKHDGLCASCFYKPDHLVFEKSVEAFNYIGECHVVPENFDIGGVYHAFVMRVKSNELTLISHLKAQGSEVVVVEIVATSSEELELEVKKHDLVLWECLFSGVGKPIGRVVAKSNLEYDTSEADFIWLYK